MRRRKGKRRNNRIQAVLAALVLAAVTCLGSIPQTVFAASAKGPTSFTQLTSSSNRSLTSGTYYYVKENVTFSASSGKNGLSVSSGTVYIYIPANVTLTVIGAAGSGQTTGGKAGLYLPSGCTLVLLGKGTLVAQGGNAASGGNGGAGSRSYYQYNSSDYYAYVGSGGSGGYGGAGAGAGIGTNGGSGGYGGSGGSSWSIDKDDYGNGNSGSSGGSGSSASSMGNLYVMQGVTVKATGGSGASGGSGGNRGATDILIKSGDATRGVSGGAGGGGGGGGYRGADIGTGGCGGGGGGGGGTAGYTWGGTYIGGAGGGAGQGYGNGYGGYCGTTQSGIGSMNSGQSCGIYTYATNGSCTSGGTRGYGYSDPKNGSTKEAYGGYAGNGGSLSSTYSTKSAQTATTTNYIPYYNVTFEGATSYATQSYYLSNNTSLKVPEAPTQSGQAFWGWQVSTGANSLTPNVSASDTLLSADTTFYAVGEKITPEAGAYGDITLTPVYKVASAPASDWGNTSDIPTNKARALLSAEDYAGQKFNTDSDNWNLLSQSVNSSGQVTKAVLQDSSDSVKVNVHLAEGGSLEGINVQCYPIFRIQEIYSNDDPNKVEYVFKLADEQYRAFFKSYFNMSTAEDYQIVDQILALTDNHAVNTLAGNLREFIKTNNIQPFVEQTGAVDQTEMVMDVSRQYTYDNGAESYQGGLGWYFIARDDMVDSTYTMQTFDKASNELILKGTGLAVKKTGDRTILSYTTPVTYTITSKVMNTAGDTTFKYEIYDWLEDTLVMQEDTLTLTAGTTTLSEGTDYTMQKVSLTPPGESSATDVYKITILWTGQLAGDQHAGEKLEMTYQAMLGENATSGIAAGNENFNRAWITCGKTENQQTTQIREWNVYTFAMTLHKQDDAKTSMKDVIFRLYKITDEAQENPLTFTKHENGTYYLDENGTPDLITNETGDIKILGLDERSYQLAETEAPATHQKIDSLTITVNVDWNTDLNQVTDFSAGVSDETLTKLSTDVDNGTMNLTVTDPRKGTEELPATGGTGRILVYVGGALLLIFSFVASVISRRREEEE